MRRASPSACCSSPIMPNIRPSIPSRPISPWRNMKWPAGYCPTSPRWRKSGRPCPRCAVQGPPAIGVLPVHYCVHDPQGNSLVIEYVQGKLHVYDNPLGVMTNSPTFDWMTTYLSNFVNLSATNVPQLDLKGFTIHQFGQGSGMVGLPGDFSRPPASCAWWPIPRRPYRCRAPRRV